MLNIWERLRKKIVTPRVYGVVLHVTTSRNDFRFLSLSACHSLEDAMQIARQEFFDTHREVSQLEVLKIELELFDMKAIDNLLAGIMDTSVPVGATTGNSPVPNANVLPPPSINIPAKSDFVGMRTSTKIIDLQKATREKNLLMKRIIAEKDFVSMDKNRAIFTEAEIKYLLEKIKK